MVNLTGLLKKYGKGIKTFIDVDVYEGEELERALEAGFKYIYAFKSQAPNDNKMYKKFRKDIEAGKVNLHYGSIEGSGFKSVLGNLREPAVFYIDLFKRHSLDPSRPLYSINSLLDIVKRKASLNHTIIINNYDKIPDTEDELYSGLDNLYKVNYQCCFESLNENTSDNIFCVYAGSISD